MRVLTVSCSLNTDSRSAALAQRAVAALQVVEGVAVDHLKLREKPLPLCDGDACYADPAVQDAALRVRQADAVLLAVPVYNYGANAAAKNLIELTGKAWADKVVGFACAAGGHGSYMSVMSLANSLMLDFRCLIVPRFVYATGRSFDEAGQLNAQTAERVTELALETVRVARALKAAPRSVSHIATALDG